jgi:hypothetical protein
LSFDLTNWTTAKYTHSFTTDENNSYVLEVHEDGFASTSSSVELDGRSAIETRWVHDGENEYGETITSETVVSLYDDGLALVSDLEEQLDTIVNKYLLVIRSGNNLKWVGRIDPESLYFEEDGPIKLSFSATDGLGRLSTIPYADDTDGTPLTAGSVNVISVIADILSSTGFGLDFYVSSSLYHKSSELLASNSGIEKCPLEYTWTNKLAFTNRNKDSDQGLVSALDVIRSICSAWTLKLFQADGAWHLTQANHFAKSTYRRWRYSSAGAGKTADGSNASGAGITTTASADYEDVNPLKTITSEEYSRTISTAEILSGYNSAMTQYQHGPVAFLRSPDFFNPDISDTEAFYNNGSNPTSPWRHDVVNGVYAKNTEKADWGMFIAETSNQDYLTDFTGYSELVQTSEITGKRANLSGDGAGSMDEFIRTTNNGKYSDQTSQTIQTGSNLGLVASVLPFFSGAPPDNPYSNDERDGTRYSLIALQVKHEGQNEYLQFENDGTLSWTATVNWLCLKNAALYSTIKVFLSGIDTTTADGAITVSLGPIVYDDRGGSLWSGVIWDNVQIVPILDDGVVNGETTTYVNFINRDNPRPVSKSFVLGDGPTKFNKSSMFSDSSLSTVTQDWEESTASHSNTDTNVSHTQIVGEMMLTSMNKTRRRHQATYYGIGGSLTPINVLNRDSKNWGCWSVNTMWQGEYSSGSWYNADENIFTNDLTTGISTGSSMVGGFSNGLDSASGSLFNRIGASFDTLLAKENDRLATVASGSSGATVNCTALSEDLKNGDPIYFQRRDTGHIFKRKLAANADEGATTFTVDENFGSNGETIAVGDPILVGSISGLRIDMDGVKIVNTHLTNDGLNSWEDGGGIVDDNPNSLTYGKITTSSTDGWIITRYGDAEFNDIIIRGMIEAGVSIPIRIGQDVGDWDDTGTDLDILKQHGIWINLYNHWLIDEVDSDAVHFKVGNATDHFYWDEATAAIKVKSNGVDIFDSSLTTSGLGLGGIIALDTDGKIVMGETTDGTILSTSGVDLVFDRAAGAADAVVSVDWEDDNAGSAVSLGYSTTYDGVAGIHAIDDWSITSAVPVIIDATGDITLTSSGSLVVGAVTYPKADGNTAGQVLYTNGSGVLTWSTDTPTDNQVLAFKSVDSTLHWIDNGTGGGGGATDINDLGDVSIVSAASGDVLRHNGTAWVDYADSNFLARANHTGTQTASTISDFDTEVSNNTSVASNTTHSGLTNNPHSVTAAQLSLVVGTDVQAHSATLDQVAAGTYTGNGGALDNQYIANGAGYVTSGGIGTVQSVATAGSVNGITLTGGPITSTGTITLGGTLTITESQISDLGAYITGITSESVLSLTDVSGSPADKHLLYYDFGAGDYVSTHLNSIGADLSTVGTITSGTWWGTAIADAYIASSSSWNTAYGWGNHASSGYASSGDNISVFTNDSGYLTSITAQSVLSLTDVSGSPSDKHLLYYDSGAGDFVSTHLNTIGADLSTVGTITSGTWWGTAIADAYISSSANWNTAYGWGNHASAGYVTHTGTPADKHLLYYDFGAGDFVSTHLNTIGADLSTVGTITSGTWWGTAIADAYIASSSSWNTAYGWGNHASSGYASSGDNISVFTNDSGYITGITSESVLSLTDVSGTPADKHLLYYDAGSGDYVSTHLNSVSADIGTVGTITSGTWWGSAIADAYISSSATWNTAYGWGNHASSGYITGITAESVLSLTDVSGSPSDKHLLYYDSGAGDFVSTHLNTIGADLSTVGTITSGTWWGTAIADAYISSSANWNTAYGWGDHSTAGYQASSSMLTSFANMVNSGDDKLVYMPQTPASGASVVELGSNVTISGGSLYASVSLTADVTGTLPVANGGTGLTSLSTLLNSNVTQQSLNVEVGVDVQAYSAMLTGFSNLLNAGDDKIVYMPESPATAPSTLEFGTGLSHSAGAINVSSGTWITSTGTITSGTWQGTAITSAYIGTHNHSATDITSGTLAVVRGGTGVTSETAISEMVINSFSSQTAGSVSGAKSGTFAYESAGGDAYALSGSNFLWEDDGATDTFKDTEFQTVDGGTQTEYRQRTVTVTDGQITAFGSWGSWTTVVVA